MSNQNLKNIKNLNNLTIQDLTDKDRNPDGLSESSHVDREILNFYKEGKREQGLRLITKHYQSRLYSLTYRMTGNHDEAMDVLQEILIQVDKSIDKFRGDSGIYTWLYRLASNVCLNHTKKVKKHNDTTSWDEAFLNSVLMPQQRPEENPEKMCENRFRQHLVEQALLKLPDDVRIVLVMHEIDGMPSSTIAESLNLSLSAVKSRIVRGRESLKKLLSGGILLDGYQTLGIIKFTADQL